MSYHPVAAASRRANLPIAMYVALAVASLHLGWRRWLKVLGVGLLLMTVVTTALSSLPILAKFGQIGSIGKIPAILAETLYQAFATPIMLYAIPLVLWWTLVTATRPVEVAKAPRANYLAILV